MVSVVTLLMSRSPWITRGDGLLWGIIVSPAIVDGIDHGPGSAHSLGDHGCYGYVLVISMTFYSPLKSMVVDLYLIFYWLVFA